MPEGGAGWLSPRQRTGGIDEVPLPGVPGRLLLCGKHHVGPDVEAVLAESGATHVVCLTERHELEDRYPTYVAWLAAEAEGRAVWAPMPDLDVPGLDDARALVSSLVDRLSSGDVLVVHCGAGIGRAGTIAAAILLALGASLDDALATVAAARPMAGPEAGPQRALLEALAARD